MNIFILDKNPIKAAQLLCDKHASKMIVESGQMLSTTHRMLDGNLEKRRSKSGKRMVNYYTHPKHEQLLYKAVHHNHPCTVWSRASMQNYIWHYDHFTAMGTEFEYRYGKKHKTIELLEEVLSIPPRNIPNIGLTPFALAMQNEPQCIVEDDAVQSYRNYYQTKQARFKMAWTKREIPTWFLLHEPA